MSLQQMDIISQLKNSITRQDVKAARQSVDLILNVNPQHHLHNYAHAILMNESLETLNYLNEHTQFFTSLPFHIFTSSIHSSIIYRKPETCRVLLDIFFSRPYPSNMTKAAFHEHQVKNIGSSFYAAISKNDHSSVLSILEKANYLFPKLIKGNRYRWFELCCRNNNFSCLPFFLDQGLITGREKKITKILSSYPKITEFQRILHIHEEKEVIECSLQSLNAKKAILGGFPNTSTPLPTHNTNKTNKLTQKNKYKI